MAGFDAAKEVAETAQNIDPTGESLSTIVQNLPPEIVANLGTLILLMKTMGVIFVIYIIFLTIRGFLTIRTAKRIKTIYKKIHIMDEKLNKLLKDNGELKEESKLKPKSKEELKKEKFKEKNNKKQKKN